MDTEIYLTELCLPCRSADWRWVRWELFLFRDVVDVLATDVPNRMLVAHRGPAQPERWLRTLRSADLGIR